MKAIQLGDCSPQGTWNIFHSSAGTSSFHPPAAIPGGCSDGGCSGKAQVSSGVAVRAVRVKGRFQACFVLKECS